jgi:hypothetical protein
MPLLGFVSYKKDLNDLLALNILEKISHKHQSAPDFFNDLRSKRIKVELTSNALEILSKDSGSKGPVPNKLRAVSDLCSPDIRSEFVLLPIGIGNLENSDLPQIHYPGEIPLVEASLLHCSLGSKCI